MRLALVPFGAVLLLTVGLAAIGVLGGATRDDLDRGQFRGNEAIPGLTLPNFELRDQNGRLVRTEDLRGTVVVLTFLDTRCTEACPIIARQIADTWRLLTPSERSRIIAVAITTTLATTPAQTCALSSCVIELAERFATSSEPPP